MAHLGRTRIISQKRTKILDLLPDTCRIITRSRVRNSSGAYSDTEGPAVVYNGLEDIPCRIDRSNRYTTITAANQETTINQFILSVPFDCPLKSDYTIKHSGNKYEIMQLMDDESFRITKWAVISRVD